MRAHATKSLKAELKLQQQQQQIVSTTTKIAATKQQKTITNVSILFLIPG